MTVDVGVFFRFLIAALAIWRLAFLLAREQGPWNVLSRLRRSARGNVVGALFTCVKCVGLWVSIPFAFFVRGEWPEVVVIWLALAGVTALIDEFTRPPFEWQTTREDAPVGNESDRTEGRAVGRADRTSIR
jgi:hypothetical protein